MTCPICGTRKARRNCPALGKEICPVCCATGREETIDCPLGCEYLHDAHQHENKPAYDPSKVPNLDIQITEAFLAQHEVLLAFTAISIFEGALDEPAITDYDIREAFQALIETFKINQSGLIIESRPVNTYAAAVVDHVIEKITDVRQKETEATGKTTIDDLTLVRILAFLQRLEYSHNNGRKRCRAFLDFLRSFYSPTAMEEVAEPNEPLILT